MSGQGGAFIKLTSADAEELTILRGWGKRAGIGRSLLRQEEVTISAVIPARHHAA